MTVKLRGPVPARSDGIYLHPSDELFQRFFNARFASVGLDPTQVEPYFERARRITAKRFRTIKNKYYTRDERGHPLRAAHVGHAVLFLYELSRQAWLQDDRHVADLLYFLNVSSTGCNVLYELDLPLRTFCDHPHGAVIGRASFSPDAAMSFSTNCCIGNNNGIYPRIEGGLVMLPNSAVMGKTNLRGNVIMSNGSKLLDAGEVADVVVFGAPPTNTFKNLPRERYLEICNFLA